MPSNPSYLFYSGDLGEALRQQLQAAVKAVGGVAEARFTHQSDDEIAAELIHRFAVRQLTLMEQHKSMRKSEIKMEISDPYRHAFNPMSRVSVDGVRVVVSIPFIGDPSLWKLRPSTWRTTFPIGNVQSGGADGGSLEILIEHPSDQDPARIKEHLDRQLSDIRFYIENQKSQISSEMAQLPNCITSAVAERRQRLTKHSNLSELLGIPTEPANPPLPTASPLSRTSPATSKAPPQNPPLPTATAPSRTRPETKGTAHVESSDKWDVFISHASEDKNDFARPLAEALRATGLHVWFDEFTLRVGDSLRRSIDKGLANSRFGVVIVSPAFLQREWPQKELDGLTAREINGEKVILPVWHKIDQQTLAKYSPTLADRLATHSAKGLDQVVADLRAAIHAH